MAQALPFLRVDVNTHIDNLNVLSFLRRDFGFGGTMNKFILSTAASILGFCAAANASISTIDESTLSFEIDGSTFKDSPTADSPILGTSNGIGFSYVGANFTGLSSVDNEQQYADLPGAYDDLHIVTGTFTFDRPIDSLLIAFANDNEPSRDNRTFYDYGLSASEVALSPVDTLGDVTPLANGVRVSSARGGLALLAFDTAIDSITFNFLSAVPNEGYDVSLFAEPQAVPLPGAGFLLAGPVAAFWFRRRRASHGR